MKSIVLFDNDRDDDDDDNHYITKWRENMQANSHTHKAIIMYYYYDDDYRNMSVGE